jgi:UDPglucose 6-dehydrogenase
VEETEMHIMMIGCGYVGLVTAAGLANLGHVVTAVDKDSVKMDLLSHGKIPIYEPGLEEITQRNIKKNRLIFSDNFEDTVKSSEVIFIAVGTPSHEDGTADLSQVESAARTIANYINSFKVIVNKSTVPVGTGKWVSEIISKNLK